MSSLFVKFVCKPLLESPPATYTWVIFLVTILGAWDQMSDDLEDEAEALPPAGVGPHEEQELELMLAGKKPMAAFVDEKAWGYDFGEERFDQAVANGDLIKIDKICEVPGEEFSMRYVYFARPEEAWRISVYYALWLEHLMGDSKETALQAEITGKLLGYSNAEIEAYIKWVEWIDHDVEVLI